MKKRDNNLLIHSPDNTRRTLLVHNDSTIHFSWKIYTVIHNKYTSCAEHKYGCRPVNALICTPITAMITVSDELKPKSIKFISLSYLCYCTLIKRLQYW